MCRSYFREYSPFLLHIGWKKTPLKSIAKTTTITATSAFTSATTLTSTTTKDLRTYDTWQWGEWYYPDDCEKGVKKRERFCFKNQNCNGTSFEVDVDNFNDDFTVHRFLIDSSPSSDLTSIFDLNYPNVLNSSLEDIDISFGKHIWDPMMCKIVIPFMNKLYVCSNEIGIECYAWDIETGEKETHHPVNNEFAGKCYFSLVEINGQIWANGGERRGDYSNYQTAFLLPNFTWVEGPNLPSGKTYHASVAINNTNVVIFGGYDYSLDDYSSDVWIFDAERMTFQIMNSYPIGDDLVACKITNFNELGNDVILIKSHDRKMYIFDWNLDVWSPLDDTWIIPSLYHINMGLYQLDNQLYIIGGSNLRDGEEWSTQVFERIDGKWMNKCNLKKAGKPHYIGQGLLPISTDALVMDSNKSLEMVSKCLRVKSPNYSNKHPIYESTTFDITFPQEPDCWNVSMRFQSHFNSSSSDCNNTFVSIDIINKDNEYEIGRFCGDEIPYATKIDFLQIQPSSILRIHFKSDAEIISNIGFILKLCRKGC